MKGVFLCVFVLHLDFGKTTMLRLKVTTILILTYFTGWSQWSVKSISDTLLKNSNVVIRRYATDIKFLEDDKVVVAENMVVTFMDNIAIKNFVFCDVVSQELADNVLECRFFDVSGKRMKQAKVKTFQKSNGFGIDIISPVDPKFPLTVEVEYKLVTNSTEQLRVWNPTMNLNGSVENASLRISVIDTSNLNYKYNRIPIPSKSLDEDGLNVFLWELNEFPFIKTGSSIELPVNELPTVILFGK